MGISLCTSWPSNKDRGRITIRITIFVWMLITLAAMVIAGVDVVIAVFAVVTLANTSIAVATKVIGLFSMKRGDRLPTWSVAWA